MNLRGQSPRTALAHLLLAACLCSTYPVVFPAVALAQGTEPSVDDVRAAGEAFNEGRTAFKDEDFATAAERFEKADQLAPNPKVLLLAIQSRERAGQLSRAATLAALAQDRYPDDETFADSRSLIERALVELAKLKVTCDAPCSLMLDSRIVHGDAATKRFLFLEPGSYKIRASFDGADAQTQDFVAAAGESGKLEFTKSTSAPAAAADETDDWGAAGTQQSDDLPAPKATYDDLSKPQPAAQDEAPASDGGLSPTVFWIGGGLTLALAGASIGMGVYTQNNPGEAAVRDGCDNQGSACPLYQEGKTNELRTNVLWGATAAAGVATVLIGALWTDWGPTTVSPPIVNGGTQRSRVARSPASPALAIEPWLEIGAGAAVGARGRF